MNVELWQIFVSLGVPGLALGVFYVLMRTFQFRFPPVPKKWVGPVVILFMLVVAFVVLFALNINRPVPQASWARHEGTLAALADNLRRDQEASLTITFAEGAGAIHNVFVEPVRATDYVELVKKICADPAIQLCVQCDLTRLISGTLYLEQSGPVSEAMVDGMDRTVCATESNT